jgi:universal stress protein E
MAIKTILVALDRPDPRRSRALARAVSLAHRAGARLVLFHALGGPPLRDTWRGTRGTADASRAAAETSALAALSRLAGRVRRTGIEVNVDAAWDYPVAEAVVRAAWRHKANLIVAQPTSRGRSHAALFTNADWELIRLTDRPVLFARTTARYEGRVVLAAVDPFHEREPSARVDLAVIEAAQQVADLAGGEVTLVHAFVPGITFGSAMLGRGALGRSLDRIRAETEREVRERLARLRDRIALPRERVAVHVEEGHPLDVVPARTRALRAPLVVLGAVSRSGLRRVFIGSTAERLLDVLACDVLVAKPRGFVSPVARRVTKRSRGPSRRRPAPTRMA